MGQQGPWELFNTQQHRGPAVTETYVSLLPQLAALHLPSQALSSKQTEFMCVDLSYMVHGLEG